MPTSPLPAAAPIPAAPPAAPPSSPGAQAALPLALEGLACRRGDRLLFKGLDYEVHPGQIVWLRGSNGRGKTSLLRLIAGLAAPAEGRVTWGGVPLRKAGAAFCQELLYLAHANALKDDLTVLESLAFLARLHGQQADEAQLAAALKRFGLHSRRNAAVRTLSQGQRRRVALARLLLAPAKALWVLDEPYDALDVDGCALLDTVLQQHAAAGGRIVLTSHLPLSAMQPEPVTLELERYAA